MNIESNDARRKKDPRGRVCVMATDNNKRGDLLTKRMEDVLHVLGWEGFVFDVANSGRELDISALHRTEEKALRAECKAQTKPAGGAELNKFAGAVQAEQGSSPFPIVAHFISLNGFTGSAIQQERDADRGIALLDGDDIIRELELAKVIVSSDTARQMVSAWAGLPSGCCQEERTILVAHEIGWVWLVFSALDNLRTHFSFVHAGGSALAEELVRALISDDAASTKLLCGLTEGRMPTKSITNRVDAAERYRTYLLREYGSITLEGLPADEVLGSKAIPLNDLYVPMSVHPEMPVTTQVLHSKDITFSSQRISIAGFLASRRQAAIVGPPGAGKSTVVKWLAANGVTNTESDDPNASFPIVVRCRSIKDPGRNAVIDVIADVIGQAELGDLEEDFKAIVRERLSDGSMFLLIDGLDEISNSRDRAGFSSQLRTFLGTYPAIRVLITSRPSAFNTVANALRQTCEIARLSDLSAEDVQLLCSKWQQQVTGSTEGSGEMVEEILTNHRVRALAVNPLLLTTMLLVKRWLGELPPKRSVLYGKAIEVLAMTWNVEAHEPLDLDEVLPQLGYVAFEMMRTGRQRVPMGELKTLVSKARKEMPEVLGYAKSSVGNFVDAVEHRSSILSLTDHVVVNGMLQPQYEFKHLVFQEFLAARAVIEGWYGSQQGAETYVDVLRPYLGKSAWEEVIRLSAMLAGRNAGMLIEALTDFDGDLEGDSEEEMDVLAAMDVANRILIQSMGDEVQITPQVASRALAAIVGLVRHEIDDDMFTLLSGKFRDLLLEAADRAARDVDGSPANACMVFLRSVMLDHGRTDPWWMSEADGGVAFAMANLDSPDRRTQLAALATAMDAGYHASGNGPLEIYDDEGSRPSLDIEPIASLGTVLRERLLSGHFDAHETRYMASWALAWLGVQLEWDRDVAVEFIAAQANKWTAIVGNRDFARKLAWSITAVLPSAELVGHLELSKPAWALAKEVLEDHQKHDQMVLEGAVAILSYAGEDLSEYAGRPDLLAAIVGRSSPNDWTKQFVETVPGLFSEALRAFIPEDESDD